MVTEVRSGSQSGTDLRRPAEPSAISGFRPDVEGLRAVAVGLVLLYHAGLPFIPGGFVGVDVFFVISGFLITGLLVKEVHRTGTVSIGGFYARRAKRLLPAAATVLAATAAATLLFIPRISWSEIGGDIVAAALYVVNWRLADRSVDYLAEDSEASPVQHFWSLAVEEQFYLVWPLLLLLAAWWARRQRQSLRHELWIGLAVIAVPSFAWSIYQTSDEPAVAFFVTTTRMWELAVGAAIALAATSLRRLPQTFAVVLGWTGLVAIGLSAFVYSTSTAWPGYAALLPTLGTAAVIAAGFAAGPRGPVFLLGTKPFTWIGGLSYSLYLWHWPMIVAASAYFGELSPLRGLVVSLAAIIPAWLTLKLVENPIRFSKTTFKLPANSLKLGAALTLSGVLIGFGVIGAAALASGGGVSNAAGARALGEAPDKYRAPASIEAMQPDPLEATDDVPPAYAKGCQAEKPVTDAVSCTFGDRDGKVTLALVGDSKALQWIGALDTIGKRQGWKVITYTKSACAFADAQTKVGGQVYTTCPTWGSNVLDKLRADPPDVVLTSQGAPKAFESDDTSGGTSEAGMIAGLQQRWAELADAGITVAVLRDNPNPPSKLRPVYECVDDHRDDLARCTFTRAQAAKGGAGATQAAAAEKADVHLVDLDDYICPGTVCPPVIGDMLLYRQGSHLTGSYVNSLAPQLQQQLEPIVAKAQRR